MDELDKFPLLYESYSKSSEVKVSAARMPTILPIVLYHDTERAEGKTYPVGDKIKIQSSLSWKDATGAYHPVSARTVKYYHKLEAGAYELISTKTTDINGYTETEYALGETGTHTFYAWFEGDAQYEGCGEETRAFAR